jgi:GNAT superfamily N-acetyltransferase
MSPEYAIRPVTAAETRPLRKEVLRPHQRLDEVGFAGDGVEGAAHFGAFVNGEMVATATVHPDEGPRHGLGTSSGRVRFAPLSALGRGWRLRGMATRDGFRGRGLGGALVEACVAHAQASGGTMMWCNARLKAADFYRRYGFEARGEVFELPQIGPHLYMWRAL